MGTWAAGRTPRALAKRRSGAHPTLGLAMLRRSPLLDGPRRDEPGSALIAATMATALLLTLGSGLILIAVTEARLAWHSHASAATLYAAEAALERAAQDLWATPDWDAALRGASTSAFIDGPPVGARAVGGTVVDLPALTNELRCGRSVCAEADIAAFTAERPWGRNNPRWQLYLWGRLSALLPGAAAADDAYLLVWVGDDPNERDGDPLRDGAAPDEAGHGIVQLTAHAYGPGGIRRMLEATVSRVPGGLPRLLTWREAW